MLNILLINSSGHNAELIYYFLKKLYLSLQSHSYIGHSIY